MGSRKDAEWSQPDDCGGRVLYVFHKTETNEAVNAMSKKKIDRIIRKADAWLEKQPTHSDAEHIAAVGADYRELFPGDFM